MTGKTFVQTLENDRMIAAVKEPKYLEKALSSDIGIIFLLTGNIGVIKKYVDLFQKHGRRVFVHLEKIGGLSTDREGVEFLARFIQPDGIITTRKSMVKLAASFNLLTVQRIFLVDTDAVSRGLESVRQNEPDAVEVMPGLIPEMIEEIRQLTDIPLITGGLLKKREHMVNALKHGAMAVSTGSPHLWKQKLSD